MIYSFHHFYYWSRGGVESGMAYRAKIFRSLGLEAKFVFATTFPYDNFQHETERLGFLDSEVMWMYQMFTDCKISPVTYTRERLEKSFGGAGFTVSRDGDTINYQFADDRRCTAHMAAGREDCVHIAEFYSKGCLIRKDYYTYCRIYSEYFSLYDNQVRLYLRRFFNEDGTVAYEEVVNREWVGDDVVLYRFPDRLIYSREELVGYMMSQLRLTEDDVVLIDGEPGKIDRSAFILNAAPAKVGFMLHGEHYLFYDEEHILWYGVYEYALSHPEKIDFFITNTEAQSSLLREQFKKYMNKEPKVVAIPVAGVEEVKISRQGRHSHSLISAGRLESEKHMEWVIEAVVEARKAIPDLVLDIYGEGSQEAMLRTRIAELNCGDYVRLCGFQKLENVYQKYDAYVSAAWVETLGVTLLEAISAGLPIVGFDVPYGMQTFVDEGENGYRFPWGDVKALAKGIVRLFTEADLEAFRQHSYKKAKHYCREELEKRWLEVLHQEK